MTLSSRDALRAQFQRRIHAWRVALLGVPSAAAEPAAAGPAAPAPPAPPPNTTVQTPAGQAHFELGRPKAQFAQPILIGAFLATYPALAFAGVAPAAAIGLFAAVMAASVAYAVQRRNRQLREVTGRVLNSAFNLIGLGRLREAWDVLAVVEQRAPEIWALRIVDIQRAIIAIRRGEMAMAEQSLTSALQRPLQAFARDNALYQLEGARALRSFVRASLGNEAGAREDIAEVLRGPASEDALARVALAEAMLLEQSGKREELRLLLTEKSTLLLEHTHPRERAIVRAFQRMVRSSKSSVYRKAEPRREKTEGEEPMLADWVAKVAPGAAAFVRSSRAAEQPATIAPNAAVARPSEAAVRANQEAKKPAPRSPFKLVAATAAGVVALGGLAAIAIALQKMPQNAAFPGAVTAGSASGGFDVLRVMVLVLLMLPVMYGVTRGLQWLGRRRAEKKVRASKGAIRTAPSREQLHELTKSPSPTVAAQAWLLLADRAERRADFARALSHSTNGLACLSNPRDRAAADIVYPDLISLRAFALAVMGRLEESNAELASLSVAYPHYSRAVFRARLLALVRAPTLHHAAQWIEQGEADLPLSVREELLADLIRATVSPEAAGAGELQRLKDELSAMPEAKAWIRAAAPHLLDAFDRSTVADVHMRIDTSGERDRLAEEEAAAALEQADAPARAAH